MSSATQTDNVHRLPRQQRALVISERPALAWDSGQERALGGVETELDVLFAHSVDAAFNLAACAPPPDLIVADVGLLYSSTAGLELARWLEELSQKGHTRLVLVRTAEEAPGIPSAPG
jgi:CheY-like chemotaxis protein